MALNFLNNGYFASKVGIGTASPITKLQISATNATSPTANIFLDVDGNNVPGMGGQIIFGTSISATLTSYNARIQGIRSGLDNGSSDIHFQTTHVATATTPSTKMTILSAGSVGIGNPTPIFYSGYSSLVIGGTSGTTKGLIKFGTGTTNDGPEIFTNVDKDLYFNKAGSGTNLIIFGTGAIRFNNYNSTNNTGTPTFLLGTDASGNIVKTNTVPGSGAGPYLPLTAGSSKKLSGDLYVGDTGPNAIYLRDSGALWLGNSLDVLLIHEPTSGSSGKSFLQSRTANVPLVLSGTSTVNLEKYNSGTNGDKGLSYIIDGALELYHNNSKKFETTSTGVTVTGKAISDATVAADSSTTLTTKGYVDGLTPGAGVFLPLAGGTMTGEITMPDEKAVLFGSGGKSFIKHTGSDMSILNDTGNISIINRADDKDIIFQSDNGSGGTATYFYLDGGGVLTRFDKRLRMSDAVGLQLGSGGNFEMYHFSGNTTMDNFTGNLTIRNSANDKDISFACDDGSGGAATYFYLDGSIVETRFSKATRHSDNIIAKFGDGNDLNIYHDSSTGISFITNSNAAGLRLQSDEFIIFANNGTTARADFDIAVKLFYDDSKKFETTNTGVAITGNASMSTGNSVGKFAVMSSAVHASFDFYNNGTSYLNGAVTIDNNLDMTSDGVIKMAGTEVISATRLVSSSKATSTSATISTDNNATLTTKGYVDGLVTGVPVYKGTWDASGTAGGTPDLRLAANKVLGNYYIVSTAGSATPNGAGTEPNSWNVGDWCIFSDITPGAGTDLWQKIDNTSVISGAGTGQSVTKWDGTSGAASETLTDGPITFSTNDSTFAGNITFGAVNPFSQSTNVLDGTGTNGARIRSAVSAAGTPTFSNSDDTDTGMFFPSANSVALSTGGTQALLIDSSQNATFAGSVTSGGELIFSNNNTGVTMKDAAGTNTRVFRLNSGNIMYIGPIDSYAGGQIFYGAASQVTGHKFHVGGAVKLTIDSSAATFAGNVNLNTAKIVNFSGTSLQILHDGSNGNVINNTGDLKIQNSATDSDIIFRVKDGASNVEVMRIDGSTSNVGIGTTTPNKKLVVKSPGADNGIFLLRNSTSGIIANIIETGSGDGALLLATNAASTSVLLRGSGNNYINSGNVGIGTTSPAKKLHVLNATNEAQIRLGQSGSGSYDIGVYSNDTFSIGRDADTQEFNIKSGNVGIGTTTPGEKLEVNTAAQSAIMLRARYNANYYTDYGSNQLNFTGSNQSFSIKNNGTSALFINSSSNVGIGTTNPTTKLNVSGSIAVSSGSYLSFIDSNLNYNKIGRNTSVGGIQITTGGNATMNLLDNGNVGIGTTSPVYKLDVNGGVQAGGKVTYTKEAGSLNTTGYAVAGITALPSGNGFSCGFTFTCFGGLGKYQKLVYSCYNSGGTWNTKKVIDEGTNDLDVVASANGSTITFTFKAKSSTQSFTPRVTVEAVGTSINSTYA